MLGKESRPILSALVQPRHSPSKPHLNGRERYGRRGHDDGNALGHSASAASHCQRIVVAQRVRFIQNQ
jgi:hypothetical protein